MSVILIKIQLKSYHPYYINRFVIQAKKRLRTYILLDERQVFLPQKITKFTVLRSPHVDKKSREQFERRTCKRILQWTIPVAEFENTFPFYYFTRLLSSLAVGVQLKLTYTVKSI